MASEALLIFRGVWWGKRKKEKKIDPDALSPATRR